MLCKLRNNFAIMKDLLLKCFFILANLAFLENRNGSAAILSFHALGTLLM